MAFRKFSMGGLSVSLSASERAAGLSFSLSGSAWQRFAQAAKARLPRKASHFDPVPQANGAAATSELQRRADAIGWYHTIDLGQGVVTRGRFDHGPLLAQYRFPERFDGLRVLDVATFDGYWAFEFERRGAREVVAMDLDGPAEIDWPPARLAAATPEELALRFGAGFALAKEALGSRVERVHCNVYDLTPGKLGTFDVVHCGDLMQHLVAPVRALQRIASVCTGYALISDVYFPDLAHCGPRPLLEYMGGRNEPTWWKISLPALREMVLDAGFSRVEQLADFRHGFREAPNMWNHVVLKATK